MISDAILLYARVSTKNQMAALGSQLQKMHAFCREASGSANKRSEGRPLAGGGFKQLTFTHVGSASQSDESLRRLQAHIEHLEGSEKTRVGAIVICDWSRLSRNENGFRSFCEDFLVPNNIRVLVANDAEKLLQDLEKLQDEIPTQQVSPRDRPQTVGLALHPQIPDTVEQAIRWVRLCEHEVRQVRLNYRDAKPVDEILERGIGVSEKRKRPSDHVQPHSVSYFGAMTREKRRRK